jgi:hypothetical protein
MVKTTVSAYSKGTAQVLLNGAQEILGLETTQKIFERISPGDPQRGIRLMQDMPFREAGPFLQALEEIYGEPGGRGLALRIGRAAFHYGLKSFDDLAGLRTMAFRLLPAPRRLENGLHTLAQFLGAQYGWQIAVLDEGDHWLWRIHCQPAERDLENQAHQAAGQDCFLIAGVLQEFASWAGGGRFYRVVETECRSSGCLDCKYRIDKRALD